MAELLPSANTALVSTQLALRPRAAAKAVGISLRLLSTLTREKRIPHLRLGRAVVYPVAELQKWLSDEAAKEMRP